ncbi:MAG: hypothetical protein ACTSP4_09790 [Candidatus Hodarchaeales archaeon]
MLIEEMAKVDRLVSFALMYVVFDEDHGPMLRSIYTHEISFPRVILRGVVTTLFTMSVGIGEPEGNEPETAIIPVSITNARGKILIYSFGIKDDNARGGRRMESFMLFLEKEHQNKFLQYSLPIVEVLTNILEDIKLGVDPENFTARAFEQIKRILLMEINIDVQSRLDQLCSEDEVSLISDGSIRSIYGIQPSPQLTNYVINIHEAADALYRLYSSQLGRTIPITGQYKSYSPALSVIDDIDRKQTLISMRNIPLEVHASLDGNVSSYLIFQKQKLALIYSQRRGRIGKLIKPLRNLLKGWEVKPKYDIELIRTFKLEDDSEEKTSTVPCKMCGEYYRILENYGSVLDHYGVYRKIETSDHYSCVYIRDTKRNKIFEKTISLYEALEEISLNMLHKSVPQIVTSFSESSFLCLKISHQNGFSCVLVGESTKGVGFMRLISKEIQNKFNQVQESFDQ